MYNVLVTLTKVSTPLPVGRVFDHTNLTVTDANGTVQHFSLNGTEATPWTQVISDLADGVSNYLAQDVDSSGTQIASVIGSYSPGGGTNPLNYPATAGIVITAAPGGTAAFRSGAPSVNSNGVNSNGLSNGTLANGQLANGQVYGSSVAESAGQAAVATRGTPSQVLNQNPSVLGAGPGYATTAASAAQGRPYSAV